MRTRRAYQTQQIEAARIVLVRLIYLQRWVLIVHEAPCAGKSAEPVSDHGLLQDA
jgi:hypothetical protein